MVVNLVQRSCCVGKTLTDEAGVGDMGSYGVGMIELVVVVVELAVEGNLGESVGAILEGTAGNPDYIAAAAAGARLLKV